MHHNRHRRHRAGGSATSARPLPDSPFRPGDSVIYYGASVRVQRINNGTVTVNGQNVTRVYIDGKTFFMDDPQLATKNIPAKKAFSVHPSLLQAAKATD